MSEPQARPKAHIIDGKVIAPQTIDKVKAVREKLEAETGVKPGLAVVIVGEDPASQVYVRNKGLKAEECGFHSETHRLPEATSEAELLALITRLNADPKIHGILAQLPLPKHISEKAVIAAIDPDKDVDGLSPINVGRLVSGSADEALVSCTPAGCLVMAKSVTPDLSGLNAVVVGRSNIVGKPVAHLLLAENCTVTIAHSRTRDLPSVCRSADILVAAVGRPKMIKGDWVKPGATVIDVGINRIPAPEKGEGKTRLVGDVDFDEAADVAGAITPVPGGVGLMTIAMLMANTVIAASRKAGRPEIGAGIFQG
ncbi:bifunctional methylenetetrahydrofolate dehydrogenase/methenyltetrahydrofolate cyclohydrolase FolD [Afifella sp. JA880]|uniref:bifunctional methylenetetrahydrofolate dehydrogenase/methenyltetrahydrofolate cyclohydrolase FolD n=1 Tax=Afifella sp. JA880 TaxID=2975280 RepID=UPI0021BB2220|nr:bifunctional methylenetetrahydrofolate dehydrogenase/methenyltetrahydrofolate cyclohydrolase FolD [Afifella sp. JA880]MCT8266735.1 bifunctional methylenetetrahydrofolate dehydrogenase/methenyltetrahydrofolate cyclohydrolase FolD [Afifella sp. JA880]